MDPRLLHYYNRELQHLREMAEEFAKEYPKIAGRLGLEDFECADPYVERLLEGFAFLASRVQLKIDSEYPRFTQHLLEMVYPHYLCPTPSMAIVQFRPDLQEGALGEGFRIPRDSVLRTVLGKGEQTACEYRTAHDVTLWPLELTEAEYFTHARDLGILDAPETREARAGVRLRLRSTAGLTFDKLSLDRLTLFLRGSDARHMRLYEQFLGNVLGVVGLPAERPAPWAELVRAPCAHSVGFDDEQALLPYGDRSFQGYRLLHEYFTMPARFMFVELRGLGNAVRRCAADTMDLLVLFDRSDGLLENAVDRDDLALFCAPAINLFPKRADRIHLSTKESEYHVVPDRTRPLDYEIYQVTRVTGHGTSAEKERRFQPFYGATDRDADDEGRAYFTVRRTPRLLSSKQRREGARSRYVGSETFVSLVDSAEAPLSTDLRQLSVQALCTNRDLPLFMSTGRGRTDFSMGSGAPVESVRCIAGPSRPHAPFPEGEATWRLISHLSLNYLSLIDDESRGAVGLRELLRLYGGLGEAATRKQIDGVRSVSSRPVTRRVPAPGPIAFARGLEVDVECDEASFEGTGVFLLGAVLEQFFARYVSVNSFTETVIRTQERGEVMRWPVRAGRRQIL